MAIKATLLLYYVYLVLCEFAFSKDSMPRFLAEPQSATVRIGSLVLLHCSVDPDSASVRWMVNGSFVTSQRRRGFDLRDGNSLRIVAFNHPDTLSHEGVYQCMATNAIGSVVSREAKLEAAVLAAYVGSHTVSDITVMEGNVAVLPCSLPDSKPRAVVEFLHNGTKLFPSARHVFLPSGSLQIARVTPSDQGMYQCSALNTVIGNSVPSPVSFRLRVTVPRSDVSPMFTATPSESVTVNQGSNLTLECAADGWPVPQVTWEKYGGHLPVGRFSQVLGNLVISGIQRFDAGTYLCRVIYTNDQSVDMVINVDVLEPPTIETAPEDQAATEGSTVVFKCRPLGSPKQGSPKPSIQWLYNGDLIVNEQFVAVRDTTLTLSNIRRRQQGIYQCIVRNGLGMAHAAARLTVGDQQTQPRAPSSASPTYGPGQPDGSVNDDYQEADEEEEEEYDLYDSDNGSWNFETGGDFAEDRPGPSKPQVSVLSNTSVLVSWQIAAAPSTVPAVDMFKIKVKEIVEESSSKWSTVDDDVSYGLRMFEVRGLKTGKTYRFRVVVIYADSERKVGPVSAKVTLTSPGSGGTPGKTRMPAPVIVEAHSVSKNKIYIGWQQPETDQWPVESFFVYFNPYDKETNVRKVKLPGTSLRNYVLSDLNPGTAYSIRMRSFGKQGVKSSFSNSVVKETLGDDGGELPNNFPVVRHVSTAKPDGANKPPVQAEGQELTRDVIGDQDPDRQLTYVIIGIVLGVAVIVVVSGTFVCLWKRERKQHCADGELKHVEQTTAFLSPATEAPNGLVSINDYAYKMDNGGHLPNCGGDCSLDKTQAGGNGICAARDGRGPGCSGGKASTQHRKMAPDLVLPSPPTTASPFHQYRTGNPEMTIYDSVDDEDHGKVSPAYAKVSSLDSMSTGPFPSQEVLGNPSRSAADVVPSRPPLDGHAYWVLDQARNQSLPERIANRVDQSAASQQGPYRQNMSASQPCNKMAKNGFDRGDPLQRGEDQYLDKYERVMPVISPFKAVLPSTPAYGEGNQANSSCDPLPWPSAAGSGRVPPNADRYLLQEQPPNGRRMVAKPTDPVPFQKEPGGQDSWKALTNQVSNGQYRIQSGLGPNGPMTSSFSVPRANDYPSSDQEDCR